MKPVQTAGPKKAKSILLAVFWAMILFLNTFTQDLSDLLTLRSIAFTWNSSPDFTKFFYFSDLTEIHQFFIIVKLGHFLGFALMDYFLFSTFKRHHLALSLSLCLAFLTEFLQLYFARDGRMYDFVIDTLGIFSMYFLLKKRARKM